MTVGQRGFDHSDWCILEKSCICSSPEQRHHAILYIYTYNYHIMHGSAIPWPWIKSPFRPTYKYACTAKALFSGTKAGWIEPGGTDLVVRCHRVWCTALWNNTFLLVLEMRKTRLKAALDSIHAEPRTLCRQHNHRTVSVFLRSVAVVSFYFIKIAQLQMDFRRAGCASSSALDPHQERSPRSPRSPRDGPMPQVLQAMEWGSINTRLTGNVG